MEGHQVKITAPMGPSSFGTTIELDGVQIKCVRDVTFHAAYRDIVSVVVEFLPSKVEIIGGAEVKMVCVCPNCEDKSNV